MLELSEQRHAVLNLSIILYLISLAMKRTQDINNGAQLACVRLTLFRYMRIRGMMI